MSQIKRLQTIDADTLQSTAYEPVSFVVDDLLPQGLHLLAGAPKIGKSWLALWLCLCAAQGKPLWTFATRPCEVLYLCLEDSFQRIQSRLFDLTEDAPPKYCKEVMEHEFRIRAKLVQRKFHRAAETDGGIETDESAEQRTAVCAAAAADPAHCDPVRSAADNEQAGKAGGRNKLGAGGNSEYVAGIENAHRPDAGAEVAHRDAKIADGNEQTSGTGWEFEREVFLQMDSVAAGLQPAGGPQVDRAGADSWHGGTGGLVWRGGDPRPVPLIPAVAGLAAVGTLMDEDEDAEEKRRRMEAKIAAENFGAAIGFAAGAAMAVKEKLDEHAAREEQKKQQHEQTMGGL